MLTRISDTARGQQEWENSKATSIRSARFPCSSRDSWIVEGFWLWIILLPSKSSSPDFKHSEKTFNRNWRPPNFLPISRSFFSFAFFFPSLSSSGSTVQPWITKPSPKFCGIKKKTSREAPAVTGTQRERHTCIYQHTSTLPLQK